jgi:hypothetical protein
MIRETCIVTALALAFSGAAWAHHGGKHPTKHHVSKHHVTKHHVSKHDATKHHAGKYAPVSTARSDAAVLARCENLRYAERVNCLHQARGDRMPAGWVGATGGTAATGMAAGGNRVRTPSGPNETQPGQSAVPGR